MNVRYRRELSQAERSEVTALLIGGDRNEVEPWRKDMWSSRRS